MVPTDSAEVKTTVFPASSPSQSIAWAMVKEDTAAGPQSITVSVAK